MRLVHGGDVPVKREKVKMAAGSTWERQLEIWLLEMVPWGGFSARGKGGGYIAQQVNPATV